MWAILHSAILIIMEHSSKMVSYFFLNLLRYFWNFDMGEGYEYFWSFEMGHNSIKFEKH